MSDASFFQLISLGSSIFGFVIQGAAIYASILFFRMDRRMHTWFLLIGSVGILLAGLFSLLMISPFGFLARENARTVIVLAAQTGIRLVFSAMFTYGLVAVALIHYRKSQTPAIDP